MTLDGYLLSALLFLTGFSPALVARSLFRRSLWAVSPAAFGAVFFMASAYTGVVLTAVESTSRTALIAHILWFIGVNAGLLLSWAILAEIAPRMNALHQVYRNRGLSGNQLVFMTVIGLGLVSAAVTFAMLGRVPLLIGISSLLGGESEMTMHQARQLNTLHHRNADVVYFGQGYLRQIYAVAAPIFLVALFLRRHLFADKSRFWIRSAAAAFIVIGSMSGQIWVGVNTWVFFLVASVTVMLVRSGDDGIQRLAVKALYIYAGILAFVFLYRYLQYLQGREFENFFYDTLKRIYGYSQSALFDIFPSEQPFRYGSTWANDLLGVLPGTIEGFAYEVHYLVHGGSWGFTLAAGIVASSYVNFGVLGPPITAALLTVLFTGTFFYFVSKQNALSWALAIYATYSFGSSMIGDLATYLVSLATIWLIWCVYIGTLVILTLLRTNDQVRMASYTQSQRA